MVEKKIELIYVDPMPETDKYGNKAMLKKLNELARCPNCGAFLVYKDESREILECPKCDFEKPTPAEFKKD